MLIAYPHTFLTGIFKIWDGNPFCAAPMLFAIVKLHMVNRTLAGKFKRTDVFPPYTVPAIASAVTIHGKSGFTGRKPWVFAKISRATVESATSAVVVIS